MFFTAFQKIEITVIEIQDQKDLRAVSSSHSFILKTFLIVCSCFFSLLINQLVLNNSQLNN